jgi:hypothetical protein
MLENSAGLCGNDEIPIADRDWFFLSGGLGDKARTKRGAAAQPMREVERMVQCAHCGVNQPVSESILADHRYYCCAAHLRQAQSDDG